MEQIAQFLELTERPAFCAEQGRITVANSAAARRLLEPGMEVEPLLSSGQEEYRSFREGFLYLTLTVGTESYNAVVTSVDGIHIFSLEQHCDSPELRALALAARELREPLSGVMASWDAYLDNPAFQPPAEAASITKGLYQLLRLVSNMTPHPAPRMEMLDLTALVREIGEAIDPACRSRQVALNQSIHPAPIYTQADGSLLTRAIHNLISNALKFTAPGGSIQLRLTLQGRTAQLSVLDSGGADAPPIRDPFGRFRRDPGLEDPRSGMGLGLHLVRSAAAAHGGAVHLTQNRESGVRVTVSLPIRQEKTAVRSPLLHIDYAGEWDPMLIELADVLPTEFYEK